MAFSPADVVYIGIFFLGVHHIRIIYRFYHNIKFIPQLHGQIIAAAIAYYFHFTIHIKFQEHKTGFMLLKFDVYGKVEVICDRCGNNLPMQLWDEFNIVVKSVDDPDVMNAQEEDPDVYYISRGESHLNVEEWIYEFINLSLPMQKMCKEDEIGGPQCNQ